MYAIRSYYEKRAVHDKAHVERPARRVVQHIAHEHFVARAERQEQYAPRESVADGLASYNFV